jgi:hypothetical protein
LIAAVLATASDETELSDEVWDSVRDHVVEATRDKTVGVRAAAATALVRLQDGLDGEDPAVRALVRLAAHDASKDVRGAAIRALSVTHETLPDLLARTSDMDGGVRAEALRVLGEKVSPAALTPTQRASVIRRACRDDSPFVQAALKDLVAKWFAICASEALPSCPDKSAQARAAAVACVALIDLEEDLDAAEMICTALFDQAAQNKPRVKRVTVESLVTADEDEGEAAADSSKTLCALDVPTWTLLRLGVASGEPPAPASLSPAASLLWRARCDWLIAQNSSAGRSELESIVPPLSAIASVVASKAVDTDEGSLPWADAFVCRQLLLLCRHADMSEEAGRRVLLEVCKALWVLPGIDHAVVMTAVGTHLAACGESAAAEHSAALVRSVQDLISDVALPVPNDDDGVMEWERALELSAAALASVPPAQARAVESSLDELVRDVIGPAVAAALKEAPLSVVPVWAAPVPSKPLHWAIAQPLAAAVGQLALSSTYYAQQCMSILCFFARDAVRITAERAHEEEAKDCAALLQAGQSAVKAIGDVLTMHTKALSSTTSSSQAIALVASLAVSRMLPGASAMAGADPVLAQSAETLDVLESSLPAVCLAQLSLVRSTAARVLCRLAVTGVLNQLSSADTVGEHFHRTDLVSPGAAAIAALMTLYCESDPTGAEYSAIQVEAEAEQLAQAATEAGASAEEVNQDAIATEMLLESGAAVALEEDSVMRSELTLALPAFASMGDDERLAASYACILAARSIADHGRWCAALETAATETDEASSGAKRPSRSRKAAATAPLTTVIQLTDAVVEAVEAVLALGSFLSTQGLSPESETEQARQNQSYIATELLVDLAIEPEGPLSSTLAKTLSALVAGGMAITPTASPATHVCRHELARCYSSLAVQPLVAHILESSPGRGTERVVSNLVPKEVGEASLNGVAMQWVKARRYEAEQAVAAVARRLQGTLLDIKGIAAVGAPSSSLEANVENLKESSTVKRSSMARSELVVEEV